MKSVDRNQLAGSGRTLTKWFGPLANPARPSPPASCLPPPASFFLAAVAATPSSAPPDIRDIVAPQPFYISGNYWLLLLAAASVLAALVVVWFMLRSLRRPKIVIPPDPQEVARRRLDALRERVDQVDPRAFGEEAADILRAFIGDQYKLQARRQTSPEFLDSVRGSTLFSLAQHTVLADFLTQCDLLKFARQDATRDAKLKLIEQATVFVDADPRPPLAPIPGHMPAQPGRVVASASAQPPPLPSPARYPFEPPDSRYMPPVLERMKDEG